MHFSTIASFALAAVGASAMAVKAQAGEQLGMLTLLPATT